MSTRAVGLGLVAALSVAVLVVSCSNSEEGTTNGGAGDGVGGEATGPSEGGGDSEPGSGGAGELPAGAGSDVGGASVGGMGTGPSGGATDGGASSSRGGAPADQGGATSDAGGSGAGGDAGVPPVACGTAADCGKSQYCLKPDCLTKAKDGVCTPVTRGGGPVCGCDGITYLTNALAATSAATVMSAGMCSENAVDCSEASCAKGLHCGRVSLRGSSCEVKTPAVCWALPDTCASATGAFDDCSSTSCLSLCSAVEQGVHAVGGGLTCAG
jgi:hypothetical protein